MTDTSAATLPRGEEPPGLLATLTGAAGALASGATTSRELVERSLHAIAATQPTLNAFRVVREPQARAEAAEADERLRRGERLPLLGVPVAIKDDVHLAGESTCFGCAGAFARHREDSEVVRLLRDAGAVVVGKTNSPEVGLYPFTETDAFGLTRSPWSLAHTPGGSSGGSAAAVAAGLVPGAVGSDGAGSVRIPAAWCHLVGVKPQRGRISTWPDHDSFNGLACLGPLTRTVADAALLLDVLSVNAREDPHAPPPPPEPYAEAAAREPGPLRVALSLRHPFSGAPVRLHPAIRAAVLRLGALLGEHGHRVRHASPRYGLIGLSLVARGESGVHGWISQHVHDRAVLDRRTREVDRIGSVLAKTALPLARRRERAQQRRVGAIFERCDVLVAPTSASPPLPVGAAAGLGVNATQQLIAGACPYAWAWNVLGWPAVSVPAGLTDEGLPIGVQLLGPANSESLLLSLAAQLERAERWHERLPPHFHRN